MTEPAIPPEWLARANRMATVVAVLSTTVHETNNALQVITGSAEMLQPDATGDVVARRADAIGVQARRASTLLAELNAYAKAEGGDRRVVDLAETAERALGMRRFSLARLSIKVQVERSEAASVLAHPWAALQIILNLLLNAERAVGDRPDARIVLSLANSAESVRLTVADNGPGVDAARLPHLFQPAFEAAGAALGIGLSVSRWLAERDRGSLDHAPGAQGGAAFILTLPTR